MSDREENAQVIPGGWIYEDELPADYPYDKMFPFSKLGLDGLGGVRIFPQVTPSPNCTPSALHHSSPDHP